MERKQKSEPSTEATSVVACDGIAQVSHAAESPIAQRIPKGKHRKVTMAQVWDWDNLLLADRIARRGKGSHYGVRKFDRDWWKNMVEIQRMLIDGTYKVSKPKIERRKCEGKWRVLAKLPYYDHVVHHALMNVCEPYLSRAFYYESAASVKGRGIHYAQKHVRRYIDLHRDIPLYWVQIDFRKCYHHVRRDRVYAKVCRMFNDGGIRHLFHEVIWALGNHNGLEESDGTEGMGIGLYPVQPLVNFYFSELCRLLAAMPNVKPFVYCDNFLLIGTTLEDTWRAVEFFKEYARDTLQQPIHENIGVQPLDETHPIDFVGYKFYKDYTHLRNSTKYKFKKAIKNITDETRRSVMASYKGWLEHGDCLHLWQTVTGMRRFSDLNIENSTTLRDGKRYFECQTVAASFLVNRDIIVKDIEENVETRNGGGRMCVLVEENGTDKKFLTNNPRLKDVLLQVREQGEFPFSATLRSRTVNGGKIDYYFE